MALPFSNTVDRTLERLRNAFVETARGAREVVGAPLRPDLPDDDIPRLKGRIDACLEGKGGETARLERADKGARRLLGGAPAFDRRHRGLARQAVVVRKRQQEFLATGRRPRQIGLSQLGRARAPRRLAALAFQAGVDAALQSRDVVVGQIWPQRRAHDFARPAGGLDESIAQAFKGSVDGIGEQQGHIPIMSQQTCHSSGGT